MSIYLLTGILVERPECLLDFFAGDAFSPPFVKQGKESQIEVGQCTDHPIDGEFLSFHVNGNAFCGQLFLRCFLNRLLGWPNPHQYTY